MAIIKEFKEFAMRGNVVDLAVGVIIGAAFGKIVTSLVADVIMPPIGYITGGVDFADKKIVLKEADPAHKILENAIHYGNFINAIIQFLIVAFCIFMMVKAINSLKYGFSNSSLKTGFQEECIFMSITFFIANFRNF